MLAEAHRRLGENPAYVQRIYGAEEVGGTSVLFLSDVPFEKLGFVQPPLDQPMPTLTAGIIGDVPTVVVVGGTLLAALYWITQRRHEVALSESEKERS
jgi:formate dehydrogenase iron-sulfur subunit